MPLPETLYADPADAIASQAEPTDPAELAFPVWTAYQIRKHASKVPLATWEKR